jgi:flagellar M-ring protein FliF
MLDGTADTLEAGAVRGIAQLVSSSVKGLKTENVTITDNAGQLLWPQGDGGAAGAAGATKQAAEARYERSLESNLNAMLARTLGPGKAQVQVKARLNVDKTTKDQLTYAKKGVPLEITAESERLRGGQARAGGAAGTAGNVPTYAAGGAGAGANSNYDRRTRTTKLGVDKLVSKTEVAPGQVERLQVSLLVDQTVPAATFQQLQNVVSTSAGLDATRGDPALTAMQVPFAQPAAAPKAGPVPVTLLSPLKWVGLGLATLIFLFFVRRNLRRREAEALPEPPWLAQIERPTPLSALEAGRSVQDTMVLPPREPNFQLRALDQMINEEPERVAAQVKSWMNEN